jgi:hypothetical protein
VLARGVCLVCLLASSAHADRFVVVRTDAPLYEQPTRDAAKASFSRPRTPAPGHLVFRVVGEDSDFVEVESNASVGGHCYQPPRGMQAVVLHAFVRRSDLGAVTTRPTTVALGDGTSVTLSSGLVATSAAAGQRRIEADDWSLRLAVPAAAVGVTYEPRSLPTPTSASAVTTPGPFRMAGQRLFELSYPLPAYDVNRRGADALATIVVRCASFRLSLPSDRLGVPDNKPMLGLVPPIDNAFSVRAGAAVYWRDGARAGSVRLTLTLASSRVAVPGRRCGQIGELPICFDDHDILPATSRFP